MDIQSNTLKAVLLISRHGDRAPNFQYPNDPHKAYEWSGGLGAMSLKGEQQMTQSGSIKSARYSSLISNRKDAGKLFNNICVISSEKQRTIKSAKYFLNGFLSCTQWPEDLVKIIPSEEDEFLITHGKPCPAYDWTLIDGCSSRHPGVTEFLKSKGFSDEMFKIAEHETGMPVRSITDILILYDILSVHRDNGLTLPDWIVPIYKDSILPIVNFGLRKLATSKIMQIRSGVLLNDMVRRLDEYFKNQTNKNIIFYSAHDLTINCLMHHMDIIDQGDVMPEYGACFAVELHTSSKSLNDDFEVKLFYFKDYADQFPVQIDLPHLVGPCSFKKFKELMEPKFTLDYDSVCRKGSDECKISSSDVTATTLPSYRSQN